MLALLISLTLSANIWTYTRTSYEGQKCYQLNIAEFEKVLLSTQDTGAEFRIQLIDYNQELSYYKLKPIKMFAKEVRDKYPNEHYAFTGYKEGKPSEIIGLVWCFKVLKQFWMILPATIEIKKTITEYVLFNPDYLATRKLNEIDNFNSTINHILNQVDEVTAEFKHHLHDANSEGESIE